MTLASASITFLAITNKERITGAIISFKVDRRDKPIKRNRESPSASFPVGKVHGRRRSGKALPTWSPWHDRLINSRNLKPASPMRIQRITHGQKDLWRIDVYVCTYIHQILVRRISHGNHSYCTNKMADGFRFRLRRGSCADLVSSLELMKPGDEGGRIVRNWFRIARFLISEISNFDDWESIDDIVINIYRSKRPRSSDWIAAWCSR